MNDVETVTSTTKSYVLKGKSKKSWTQLPEEVISLIATHYLYTLAEQNYCPQTWDNRKLWYSRMAYTGVRDALDLERHISDVCPEWRRGIEQHPFWSQVTNIIDPNDLLLHLMVIYPKAQVNASSNVQVTPIYLSPHTHVHNLLNSSCIICRVNYPLSNYGLTAGKKLAYNATLGYITVCAEHAKRKAPYCGACLREAPILHPQDTGSREYELAQAIGIAENEDDDTWSGVEYTCRKCRSEWLWRKANQNPRDREALGGMSLQGLDWEVRQHIDAFIELAEGTIADVLTMAREKYWLRINTKYESLGQHALAAQRRQETNRDHREDKDALLLRGSGQAREWALQDWARCRVLEGDWIAPADTWYNNVVPGHPTVVPTVHPCPWILEVDGSESIADDELHSSPSFLHSEIPPTFGLCQQAYMAYLKQLRETIMPALRNVVRKIVMECSLESPKGYDLPSERARRMSLEEVVKILREEEGVWYDGVDWVEKKKNEDGSRPLLDAPQNTSGFIEQGSPKEDDSDSTTSSSSNGCIDSGKSTGRVSSNATSPVLSTSTFQTTPSPPPIVEEATPNKTERENGEDEVGFSSYSRLIPVDPVKSPPRLLSKIPFVPVTISHLPYYSMEVLKNAWRDACSPIFQCCCTICERAKLAEIEARAAQAALNPPHIPTQHTQQTLRTALYSGNTDSGEIVLEEVVDVDLDGDGEEEIEYDASDIEYDEDEDDEEYDDMDYRYSPEVERVLQSTVLDTLPSRKRLSDEVEDPLDELDESMFLSEVIVADETTTNSSDAPSYSFSRDGSGRASPKRPRLDNLQAPMHLMTDGEEGEEFPIEHSPGQLRKRGSEELEEEGKTNGQTTLLHVTSHKRVRVGDITFSHEGYRSPSQSSCSGDDKEYKRRVSDKPPDLPNDIMRKSDVDISIALEDADV